MSTKDLTGQGGPLEPQDAQQAAGAGSSPQELGQRLFAIWTSPRFMWVIVGLGIFLVTAQYLHNRALWLDEGFLALNIKERSLLELMQPLSYEQGAPVGFLWLVKLTTMAFGLSDWTLRLVPLVYMIIGVIVFAWLSRCWLPNWLAPFAALMVSTSGVLIYYGSEFKQYGGDFMIASLVYLVVAQTWERGHTCIRQMAVLSVMGAVVLWLSHGAMFILCGVGLTLGARALLKRDMHQVRLLTVVALSWGVSFVALYLLSLRDLGNSAGLHNYWERFGAFPAMPPKSMADLLWYPEALVGLYRNEYGPLAMRTWPLLALLAVVGIVYWARREPFRLALLVIPVGITLGLAMLARYPFHSRLLLFCIPALVILPAVGVDAVVQFLRRSRTAGDRSQSLAAVAAGLLIVGNLAYPAASGVIHVMKPRLKEDIRPALKYLGENLQEGDLLWVYNPTQYQFRFYGATYGFDRARAVIGEHHRLKEHDAYVAELMALEREPRVWVLSSHYSVGDVLAADVLATRGHRLGGVIGSAARVDLFDLTAPPDRLPSAPAETPTETPAPAPDPALAPAPVPVSSPGTAAPDADVP